MTSNTILILANSLGGLFSFRKEVVAALVETGYKVVIVCPQGEEGKRSYFEDLGCLFSDVEMDRRGINPLHDLSLLRCYNRLIHSINPQAVLTYTIKPNIYGGIAARWQKVPQLANITGLGTAIENPGPLQKFTIALYRFGLKKARMVFYQNSSIEVFCRQHHIGKTGHLLPGSGVNLDWHSFMDYPPQDANMKFNFIGRVMKDKGIEEFLETAQQIHAKYPQTEFHVLGDCEEDYETQLKTLQKNGIVNWHGAVSDVRPYIEEAFASIHPSYHEGMANVLLETCAAGRPVIACDINGCKEAIDDGINGYLCRVKDAQDLTDKVEQFINLPYEQKVQMGLAARKKVEKEFDRQLVIDAYLDEIKRIE